jgi:hypothetical protein
MDSGYQLFLGQAQQEASGTSMGLTVPELMKQMKS